jgi:hypothetical protein
MTLRLLGGLILLAALAGAAEARCRVVTNCSKWPCEQVQECDSALDTPAQPPPGSGPIWPFGSRPPSIPGTVPPGVTPQRLGPPPTTSGCRSAYVCWSGRCSWEKVCE